MKGRKKARAAGALKNVFIALVLLFLFLPIVVVIVYSFNTSEMNILFEGFTAKWYGVIWQDYDLMDALNDTLIVAFFSTVISTVIGTIGAVGMSKYRFRGKKLLDKILYIPVVVPEIVLGIALLCMYSVMQLTLGLTTITLSHITFCIPFVIISVRARLAGLDPSLEEAAMDLGANRIKTFVRVILPLLLPGVLSGAMLSLCLSLDDIVISFFTSGPDSTTLPIYVYSMVRTGVTPEVNALYTIIMLVTIGVIAVNTVFNIRKLKSAG
jgi:ABC-type spermidine/putrescine transport system, permease component II